MAPFDAVEHTKSFEQRMSELFTDKQTFEQIPSRQNNIFNDEKI